MISTPHIVIGSNCDKTNKTNISPEFRLEPVLLITEQVNTVQEAANTMNVGKWKCQLRLEHNEVLKKTTIWLCPDHGTISDNRKDKAEL